MSPNLGNVTSGKLIWQNRPTCYIPSSEENRYVWIFPFSPRTESNRTAVTGVDVTYVFSCECSEWQWLTATVTRRRRCVQVCSAEMFRSCKVIQLQTITVHGRRTSATETRSHMQQPYVKASSSMCGEGCKRYGIVKLNHFTHTTCYTLTSQHVNENSYKRGFSLSVFIGRNNHQKHAQ